MDITFYNLSTRQVIENTSLTNESWSVSEMVITMPCHGVITGSNPVQTAKEEKVKYEKE